MAESHRDEIAKLEALFAANPDGRIFTHLAEAYRKAGDLARARETVEQGLVRHPDYPSAHVVLARVLWDLGETVEAERSFRRVLELDPENRVALRGLGDLAFTSGRTAEALNHYRTLLLLDPGDEEVEALVRAAEEDEWADGGVGPAPGGEGAFGGLDLSGALDGPGDIGPIEALDGVGEPDGFGDAEPADGIAGSSVLDDGGDVGVIEGFGSVGVIEGYEATSSFVDEAGDPLVPGITGGLEAAPEGQGLDFGGGLPGLDGIGDESPADGPGVFGAEPFTPESDDAGTGGEYQGRLLTETMGDLFARQGLYTQAADVYRELLRERPEDERLAAKLNDAEARAAEPLAAPDPFGDDPLAGLGAGEEEFAPESTEPLPTIEDAFDGFSTLSEGMDGAASDMPVLDWSGGDAEGGEGSLEALPFLTDQLEGGLIQELVAADAEVVGAGWETSPAPAAPEPSIGEYLRKLLSFAPAAPAGGTAVASGEGAVAGDDSAGLLVLDEGAIAEEGGAIVLDEDAIVAEGTSPVPGAGANWQAEAPLVLDEGAIVEEAAPLLLDEIAIVAEDGGEDEFDRLFGGGAGRASGGAAAGPAESQRGGAAPGGDDDEDLEMFRAWLQNLKR